MSVAVRVIPCLDVSEGRVVKGVNFVDLVDAGDPVELAARYDAEGADELTFLDITATSDNRETAYDMIRRTAEQVFIPLTVGGGVRSVGDIDALLRAGADKVSINSAAVARPDFLREAAQRYGAQCVVLAIDARRAGDDVREACPSGFEVTTHGGRRGTGIDAVDWARRAEQAGAGEILLTSMDADGTKQGFDAEMISAVRAAVSVPLIASGGAGQLDHFPAAVEAGADAVLAASVFHFDRLSIAAVKQALADRGHPVRLPRSAAPRNHPVSTPIPPAGASAGAFDPATLRFDESGLICAVAQSYDTREVLMVAWMDAEALRRTVETGAATYFSRSRREYWVKGETSGNTQRVVEIRHDCDGDALLLLVDQHGPACHTGTRSCFENRVIPMADTPE